MRASSPSVTANAGAFSLVELLVAVAVIAIMATFMLPLITGHRESAQLIVARQQQAELQTALGSWVAAQSSLGGGLAAARAAYATADNKLSLVENYLQPATREALEGTNNSSVTSPALNGVRARLQFSSWTVGGTPSVDWINTP